MPADAAYDVFLSYARDDDARPDGTRAAYDRHDESFIRRLYDALTAAELRVWWDRKALPSRSTPFPTEIERAIHDCPRFLFVVGPGAIASEWVQAELHCAQSLCKAITPILRVGDYALLPASLSDINMIDCRPTRDFAAAVSDVIERLRQSAAIAQPYGIKKPLPDHFVMREKPFNDARAAICADAVRPTVISAPPNATAVFGMGGVGKSTLATALVQDCQVRRHFNDGILWIEVGQTPTVTELQAAVGVHYGDDREKYKRPEEARIALSQKLHQLQALLVLDDVWDHEIIQAFPVSGTQCRLLITTRSRVLADKIAGKDIPVDLLTPREGAQLLAAAVGGSADDPLYQQISTAFDGHTLSIELAAARLRKRGAAFARRLLDGLEDMANPFADLNVDPDDKNLNLEKSLAQSYLMLDNDDLRRRFRLLGVFAREGTVDVKTLMPIWGDSLTPNSSPLHDADASENRELNETSVQAMLITADRALEALLDADLIQPTSDGRYRLHRLVHAYARALLAREREIEFAAASHFFWYSAVHGDQVANMDYDAHPLITYDFDNILTSLEWGFARVPQRACDLVIALAHYMSINVPLQVQKNLLLKAETAAHSAQYNFGLANILNAMGTLSGGEGNLEIARSYYNRALSLFTQVGDQLGIANTLIQLGNLSLHEVESETGNGTSLKFAKEHLDRALSLYEQIGQHNGIANTLSILGNLSRREGNLERSRRYYKRALPIHEQVGDRLGLANTLKSLGDLSANKGALDAARGYYDRALSLATQIGDKSGQLNTLRAMARLAAAQGNLDVAKDYYRRCLALANTFDAFQNHPVMDAWSREYEQLMASVDSQAFAQRLMEIYPQGDTTGLQAALQAIGRWIRRLGN